jgi:hypothetical protein
MIRALSKLSTPFGETGVMHTESGWVRNRKTPAKKSVDFLPIYA